MGQLRPKFCEKSLAACKMVISQFLARNQLTHHVATHKAQRCPGEVCDEALTHLKVQVPRVNNLCHHQDFFLNMDRTPIYQAMDEGKTIDVIGARTVNLYTWANDNQRVTVAVMITASGKRLPSMTMFKGECGEQNTHHDCKNYSLFTSMHCVMQVNGAGPSSAMNS